MPSARRSAPASRSDLASALDDIRALVAALGRSARTVEQETGVSNAQLFLLRELAASPGLTINQLAERAMTRQSTVSELVTRLESAGLVRREREKSDARRVNVALTREGEQLAKRAPEPATTRLIDALRRMRPGERKALAGSLAKLRAELRLPAGSPPLFESLDETDASRRHSGRTGTKRAAPRNGV